MYCTDNIQIVPELGRFQHLEITQQIQMMNLQPTIL